MADTCGDVRRGRRILLPSLPQIPLPTTDTPDMVTDMVDMDTVMDMVMDTGSAMDMEDTMVDMGTEDTCGDVRRGRRILLPSLPQILLPTTDTPDMVTDMVDMDMVMVDTTEAITADMVDTMDMDTMDITDNPLINKLCHTNNAILP